MTNSKLNKKDDLLLLKEFNGRDRNSFGEVYCLYFKELCFYCKRLSNEENAEIEDFVQDIFLKLWSDKKIKFESLLSLKSYLYKSIHNSYINRYNKKRKGDEIINNIFKNEDIFEICAVETEVVSLINIALDLVPSHCADSFKLFLDGYNNKEIANMLHKPETTINSQKQKAIKVLKGKLPRILNNVYK